MSVKIRLNLILFLVIMSIVFFVIGLNIVRSNLNDYNKMEIIHKDLDSHLLELRKDEKDFFIRLDLKYVDNFNKLIEENKIHIEELNSLLMDYNLTIIELQKYNNLITSYKNIFNQFVEKQKEIGLSHESGLYEKLRKSVHLVEDFAKKSQNYELLSTVYNLRKQEKDFMLRKDLKYVENFKSLIEPLINNISDNTNKENLRNYKKDFFNLVNAESEIGLTHNDGLQSEIREIVKKVDETNISLGKNLSLLIEEKISFFNKTVYSFITIFAIILIFIIYFTSKQISNSLNNFRNGLLSFFAYLNREAKDVAMLDDNSKDEFGEMANVVNQNIEKTKKGIEEDRKLIDETISVLGEFEQGDLCQRLNTKVSNPALMQLSTVINGMGDVLEKKY